MCRVAGKTGVTAIHTTAYIITESEEETINSNDGDELVALDASKFHGDVPPFLLLTVFFTIPFLHD